MLQTSACLLVALLAGCGEEGPSASLVADIGALQLIVDRDPAVAELEIVDRVFDDERPVHAARLLRRSAIPAAERQVELVEGAGLRTSEGRAFAVRVAAAYRARVSALEIYRHVLEGGVDVEPMELLDAIRARREAEQQLLRVVGDMTALAPPAPEPRAPAKGPTDVSD